MLHTNFDRAIKPFMLTYQVPVDIAGPPANEKRDELEELSWSGINRNLPIREIGEGLATLHKFDGDLEVICTELPPSTNSGL